MAVDRKKATTHKGDIRKRTPLEQAIAEQTSPNARYEAKLRQQGFRKTTIWVRSDRVEDLKAMVKALNEAAPQEPVQ